MAMWFVLAVAAARVTGECVSEQTEELFVWTEWPGSYDPVAYYAKLLRFMDSNCIGARVSRVILRVLHPEHPTKAESFWWPPTESTPFYAAFLQHVKSDVTLTVYPYLMEELAGGAWQRLGGTVVGGVYEFIERWNGFLGSRRLSGAVFDLEENGGLRGYSGEDLTLQSSAGVGREKGYSYEVTVGFDEIGKMRNMHYDRVYGQFYDFYAPVVHAGRDGVRSPFVVNRDDAEKMAEYVVNEAVGRGLLEKYREVSTRLMVMWSNQNIGGECIYGDGSGRCGLNYEFGGWSAEGFHSFIKAVKKKSDVMGELQHGIFQFSFTPQQWIAD